MWKACPENELLQINTVSSNFAIVLFGNKKAAFAKMEVTQDGLTEEEQNKLEFQENFGGNEMTDCQAKDNIIELENVVIIENKEKDMEANAFGSKFRINQ